ncbi:MAG: sulfate ABC transporter permease subunit CysT [Candidatus Eremiobacteraeota bacterium]|nr:sulfate ABC transporter permease subunit CysT [Candidatus Eremiobacteraeota bacterium]
MKRDAIPGRAFALGTTVAIVTIGVLIPLAVVAATAAGMSPARLEQALLSPRALAAFRLTFGASILAAIVDVVAGTYVAWILVRYQFRGRSILDAVVDIPLALPTAVSGIALATLYGAHGWIGSALEAHGLHVAYTPLGVCLALTFCGFPFVVRTVQPALASLPPDLEEAATSLGAGRTAILARITLPLLIPSMLAGFALALARALGEYGSVVFISGNMPLRTEIVPLLVITRLEEYDYQGAAAIATVLLLASFFLSLGINVLQRRFVLAKVRA